MTSLLSDRAIWGDPSSALPASGNDITYAENAPPFQRKCGTISVFHENLRKAKNSIVAEAREKFNELAQLTNNWDSYGAPPLDSRALSVALKLWVQISVLLDEPSFHLVPTTSSGVAFEWDTPNGHLEIEVLSNGRSIEYFYADPARENYSEGTIDADSYDDLLIIDQLVRDIEK